MLRVLLVRLVLPPYLHRLRQLYVSQIELEVNATWADEGGVQFLRMVRCHHHDAIRAVHDTIEDVQYSRQVWGERERGREGEQEKARGREERDGERERERERMKVNIKDNTINS